MKRLVDLVLGTLGLIVMSPLLAAVAVCIRVTMGSPVLFRQARAGRNGTIFTMVKFRTMANTNRDDAQSEHDAHRLTDLGRFLRATSLDELPELWNVVKGDMSLVGPRPLLPEYLDLYTPEQARRHNVRPGITGWAQVNGRNALTWDEKFRLDVWYVDHQSGLLDVRIVALTVWKVFSRHGISAEGEATMPRFKGSTALDASRE